MKSEKAKAAIERYRKAFLFSIPSEDLAGYCRLFKEIAEIAEQELLEKLTHWIDVEEELPPERVSVLTKAECDGEVRYEVDFVLGGKFMKKPAPRWWRPII